MIVSKGDIEMDRRQFLKNSTAAIAAAGTGAMPWRARAQAAPIKIGLLAPLTGVVDRKSVV